MAMQVHEIHPSVIHFPLATLPAAAIVDVLAASARPPRRYALDAVGRTLWWIGVGAAAVAGMAGMAASQEIHLEDDQAHDAMWLHGMGNTAILLASAGLAAGRSRHRATAVTAGIGTAAVAAALYTAWLGGELVYTHGAGVKAMPPGAGARIAEPTPVLSVRAPWVLARDAARGLGWLMGRGRRLVARRAPLATGAATQASELTGGPRVEMPPPLPH